MAAVITYWQLPEDEDDFFAFLATTGNVAALIDRWVKQRSELTPRPIEQFVSEGSPNRFVFGLGRHLEIAEIAPVEKDGSAYFTLTGMSACVISYQRGQMRDGNKLGQSNLAASWNYPDKDARTLLSKDEEFIKWAKNVFAWIRRRTPEQVACNGFPYRATKRVRDAIDRNDLEAVLY